MESRLVNCITKDKIVEVIEALKKCIEKQHENKKTKQLFGDDDSERLLLQIDLKKIPMNKTTYIHSISLPNHWNKYSDIDTCLIVKDIRQELKSDRETDLEMTKEYYKKLLQDNKVDDLINEIITLKEIQTEFNIFEAKNKLCSSFDLFFTDKKLINNKYKTLPRVLGKQFWIVHKKVPIPLNLNPNDSNSNNLKSEIEEKLNETHLYVSGSGNTLCVTFGIIKQNNNELVENLVVILNKLDELFGINIRSLKLKTKNSIAIPFYLDCGFISDVKIMKNVNKSEPIIDEFSHFINSDIAVYPNGTVRIINKVYPNGTVRIINKDGGIKGKRTRNHYNRIQKRKKKN